MTKAKIVTGDLVDVNIIEIDWRDGDGVRYQDTLIIRSEGFPRHLEIEVNGILVARLRRRREPVPPGCVDIPSKFHPDLLEEERRQRA